MTYKLGISFLILSVSLNFGCGEKKETVTVADVQRTDSLSIKLNSPELKAVNAELLKDPADAALYNKRALIYLKLAQFPEAVGDALRSIKLDSSKAEHYLCLADVYFAQNKTKLAKETLEIIDRRFPSNTEGQLKLGELFFLVKDYQKAIDHVNKALKVNENLAAAYFLKGNIYRESGDTAKAVSSYMTATEQDPKFAMAWQDLGVIHAARKNVLAFDYYNNALKLEPGNLQVKYGIAKLLQDIGKTDEALKKYEQILAADPTNANCLYNMGAIFFGIRKDHRRAVEYFTKAIAAQPEYVEAYLARGLSYAALKDRNSAKADYEMCLRLQPNFPAAIQGLNELK